MQGFSQNRAGISDDSNRYENPRLTLSEELVGLCFAAVSLSRIGALVECRAMCR